MFAVAACTPTAVLLLAVVFPSKALLPTPTLLAPVVFNCKALTPRATLLLAVSVVLAGSEPIQIELFSFKDGS